ncbi:MAG: hypothetical protein PUK21_07750 [Peptostreptococcaceae bacterium]|nr:hypothetical protein [Peptostreptococcaceae bacterium]MDY5738565.1 hypothetical protein [Anaerovoracaceae bacterium]SFE35478.1 hypothetical protein SAMN02910327_00988 [Peptostreptococcaceae bacterium pGA-8]
MKDLIVIVGTMLLGCAIFAYIAGENDSIKSSCRDLYKRVINEYRLDK